VPLRPPQIPSGFEPGKPATNHLNYGTAYIYMCN
jgi:hypothetical protein